MSNEIFPQIPNALDTGLPAVESATELPTSQTSAPELGGADVELQPANVGLSPTKAELVTAALEAIRLTDLAQNQ